MNQPTDRPWLLARSADTAWFKGTITAAELDRRHQVGELPLSLANAMSVSEAAGVALLLPPVRANQGDPIGYGVLPPAGAEPLVKLGRTLRGAHGDPIKAGARGVVGCIYRESTRPDRVVFRLWFRGEARPRMVDTWDDSISAVCGIEGSVPHTTGWQVCRLDSEPGPTVAPTSSSTGVTGGLWVPGDTGGPS